jgi:hypothetical protein
MSMIVIDEDHYVVDVVYRPGSYTFAKDKIGTRYALIAIRLLVDPADPKDLQQVQALQNALKIEQPGGPGRFEIPNWDPASQKKVRDPLVALGETLPDWRNAVGRRGEVDPVRHLIVTATGWGLNPDKDAIYLNVTPSKSDGTTIYKLTVKDVPVDGFWSISLYNGEGYFVPNKFNAYTLNNITAKKSSDGAIAIQFGGCDGKIPNCLPTMPGWNYIVRLYRPRAEILDGKWKYPEAQPSGRSRSPERPESARPRRCRTSRPTSAYRTDSRRSALATGTTVRAPEPTFHCSIRPIFRSDPDRPPARFT